MRRQNKNWWRNLIPKEHGAWVMWIMPLIIGAVAAGQFVIETWLIFGACLSIFAARTALASAIRLRRRSSSLSFKCMFAGLLELLIALGLVAPILLQGQIVIVIVGFLAVLLLLADLWWIREHAERNLVAEFLGVAGFTLTAPAAYVASAKTWNFESFLLWLISFGYFVGSIFYVKLRVLRMVPTEKREPKKEILYTRLALGYVVIIISMTLLFSILTWIPGWLVLAFLPWSVHILWEVFGWQRKESIYRVGWTLVAHAVYFTIFVSLIFALS
jgi:hypothetical protein